MSAALSQLGRRAIPVLERLIRAEEISVPDAAKLLKKDSEWVRANLPVIVHSRKSHHVRLVDIEAYQDRRTIWPKLSPSEFESVFSGKRHSKFGKRAA